ncbi:MAG: tol-pal system protein YbgF [Parahaliea sp.]
MRYRIGNMLAASGLVLVTSPLCFTVQAQDYIDVEAEQRAAKSGAVKAATTTGSNQQSSAAIPKDPYGVQPAASYPATSYGINTTVASEAIEGAAGSAATAVGTNVNSAVNSATAVGGSSVGQLLLQVQQLQQEVMRLNGKVEEQAHELRTLKEQGLERYVDLDRRVSALTTGGVPVSSASSTGTAGESPAASSAASSAEAGAATNTKAQPGEADAYRAAYALVRAQKFDQGVSAFKQFLTQYPAGRYAPNAHYWLGELYLVAQPADLEASRQAFTLLIDEYPKNAKVPDAMYKLGRVHFMKGNREKAREYLDQVVQNYSKSNASAARLAQQFIDENY